ncbi:hypothetical protein VNO77_34405 [Canavalia gladiata]|uniref:Uncharacterized protein n=1 Tax=Canavalia gladiata TaxID=3824 RepID=A0AAN9PZ81_CANGL
MESAIPSILNPKSPTFRERNTSPLCPHLTPHQPNRCEPHHALSPNGFIALDHDSTKSELNTFNAHKYFNQVTNNDNIQKVTINSNSRVSPLLNMDMEYKHNPKEGDITKSTCRSLSYSASSSLGSYANINNYKAHSFHVASPTPPPFSSSKPSLNSKAGLLFHPQTSPTSGNPPQSPSDLSKKIRTSLAKPIWLLRRNCPCNDKKSVQVKKNIPKPKIPVTQTPPPQPQNLSSHNQIHKDHVNHKTASNKEVNPQRLFQFHPAMNQVPRTLSEGFTFPLFLAKPQVLLNVVHEEEDTPSRDSLQIFQRSSPSKSRTMDDDASSDAKCHEPSNATAFTISMLPIPQQFVVAAATNGE